MRTFGPRTLALAFLALLSVFWFLWRGQGDNAQTVLALAKRCCAHANAGEYSRLEPYIGPALQEKITSGGLTLTQALQLARRIDTQENATSTALSVLEQTADGAISVNVRRSSTLGAEDFVVVWEKSDGSWKATDVRELRAFEF